MKRLQAIAMGLLIVALGAEVNGYDLVADPLGWLLVLHGVRRLPRALPLRDAISTTAVLATVVSVPLWFPDFSDALADTDDSLVWAATLPQLVFVALLCTALSRYAAEAADRRAATWLRTAATLTVAVGVLPIVVYPIEPDLLIPLVLVAVVTIVLVIVLLFRYAARPWIEPDGATEVART